jgi:hypothetical protein
MQGGKNWILPKYINANRFFWDSHWLEIWSNHFCPSMGLNGGSVATDSGAWGGLEPQMWNVDALQTQPYMYNCIASLVCNEKEGRLGMMTYVGF